jgi:hypothetical protein
MHLGAAIASKGFHGQVVAAHILEFLWLEAKRAGE